MKAVFLPAVGWGCTQVLPRGPQISATDNLPCVRPRSSFSVHPVGDSCDEPGPTCGCPQRTSACSSATAAGSIWVAVVCSDSTCARRPASLRHGPSVPLLGRVPVLRGPGRERLGDLVPRPGQRRGSWYRTSSLSLGPF
uniref:Uncharacterized protein n=1 Tax=Myotis myotis TaxID=51298 RepID=A0A7J7RUT6_MYOMY|nr:hypothetical protein mMyoMyo1_010158 [Myotis myotis]